MTKKEIAGQMWPRYDEARAKIERLHVNPPKGYREQCEKRGHAPLVGKLAPEVQP